MKTKELDPTAMAPRSELPPPGWGAMLRLILVVWILIVFMTALLQLWIGNWLILHLLAFFLAGGFALAAIFDCLWRRR